MAGPVLGSVDSRISKIIIALRYSQAGDDREANL